MSFFTVTEVTNMVKVATKGPFAIPEGYYPSHYDESGPPFWVRSDLGNALKRVCEAVDNSADTVDFTTLSVESFGNDPSHHHIKAALDNFMKLLHDAAAEGERAFLQPKNKKQQEGKTQFPFPFDYLFDQMGVKLVDVSSTFYDRPGGVCFHNTPYNVQLMAISLLNWLAARA